MGGLLPGRLVDTVALFGELPCMVSPSDMAKIEQILQRDAVSALFWELLGIPPCPCGQPLERDTATIGRSPNGRLAVRCPHCGHVLVMQRMSFEP